MSDYSKFETVAKIQEILEESGLYWSCSYSPSNDSYSIFICDEDDEDGEIISRGLNND